jgi:hypothetical protein
MRRHAPALATALALAALSISTTHAAPTGLQFTKICMSGETAGSGACPADPALPADPGSPGANEWACTRDQQTNLVWSIESIRGNWDDATTARPADYEAAKRCGLDSGWRAPSRDELLTIIRRDSTSAPPVDEAYFPNTVTSFYWTADSEGAEPASGWLVYFLNGNTIALNRNFSSLVRLVHSE